MLARVLRYQRWSKSFANGKAIEARVRSRFAGSLVKDSDAEELAEAQRQKWEREFLKASGGAEDPANGEFKVLLNAVRDHQELLKQNNIGVEVSQRERIKVNANRVGLEAPTYLDELPGGSSG
mmetsp:Transcript_10549/g.43956  ORF Transcript_10549/g.43956 Transcript_10549/m.43956 type:complete len:123 (-) Transcript_10549:2669-3037(-)|eukprot:CAMPEP_0113967110 /NCGR_PEP_ID=MMETSP0011_2-20120614/8732_1 /TAXON_ID=101924 /ORGANISM="Rhodosorus marinus" /LENGTH=122 /DNA_ID=CAMNT_0000979925 /DNA_START=217 /DNA_END=585 /DNA_ORIENTATION=- /assembly_acc=CAM_ASM_000156